MRLRRRRKQLRYLTVEELEERSFHLTEWLAWASREVKSRELRPEYRERLRGKLVRVRQELRLIERRLARGGVTEAARPVEWTEQVSPEG